VSLIKGIAFPLYFLFVCVWRRRPWSVRLAFLTLVGTAGACGVMTGVNLPSLAP
jgi:hypothetical protein